MQKYFFFGSLLFCLLLSNCKNNKPSEKSTPIDPLEAAKPHGESLPNAELSEADKLKLGEAQGISAIGVSKDEIDSLINASNDLLHIYSFFKKDSLSSHEMNETLFKLQKEVGEKAFKVILFSLDHAEELAGINT